MTYKATITVTIPTDFPDERPLEDILRNALSYSTAREAFDDAFYHGKHRYNETAVVTPHIVLDGMLEYELTSIERQPQHTDDQYRDFARDAHQKEGEIEIDNNAMVSYNVDDEGSGAYVQAWVWVEDQQKEED